MSLVVKSKTEDSVNCEVVDGGELKSRRHLNVRGKSAALPSITEKDWDDIKFGVDNKVDFYVVSFVKDAAVVHELKNYLKSCGADIHVIPKIESADFIPNLHSIITASDGGLNVNMAAMRASSLIMRNIFSSASLSSFKSVPTTTFPNLGMVFGRVPHVMTISCSPVVRSAAEDGFPKKSPVRLSQIQ
ncbi:hypothetical protein POM88_022011 [Heracleum sosnowskyi]|uniref:Pyruvate kinase n=1 Tax=Heracleum sosnowskyi TaxID=360622 RepID=A0AAD8IF31_9APIA|nr:hypothetical protein POM88_022011 [Heracleum sosnowskyi]